MSFISANILVIQLILKLGRHIDFIRYLAAVRNVNLETEMLVLLCVKAHQGH